MKEFFREEINEPLCYGYLIADKIGFKAEFDIAGYIRFENPIGMNLINFAWLDEKLILDILVETYGNYITLFKEGIETGYLLNGMIDFFKERHMEINCYLDMYLLGFIEFLLRAWVDRRLLSNVAVESFAEGDEPEFPPTKRGLILRQGDLIEVFYQSILERQALVEQTLTKVLGDGNEAHPDALSRFYEYESQDALFREHWHSRFEVSFGKRADNLPEIIQLSALARIDDMLRYELVQMLVRDVQYKCCRCCGKLFIPSGRSDSLYCSRIMPGMEQPCNKIGANLVAKEKVKQSPALELYRQAYQRLNKRVEFNYMTPKAFDEWKAQARPKREQCLSGKLSLEEFELWIDETSRQRNEGKR